MREAALWISGAALAFLATAGAFLLLANLGTGPSERNLSPDAQPEQSGPALDIALDQEQLASLEAQPGQVLRVRVSNPGDEDLSHVNLTVEVSSENTAVPNASYYRENLNGLTAGNSVPVPFYIDLSEAASTVPSSASTSAPPEAPRKIIEVRATTPEGISTIKTAVVPV